MKTCIQENPIASKTHSSSQAFESQLRQLQTQFQAQEESFKNELDRLQKLTQTQTRELERSKATVQVKEQEYIKLASDVSRYREELQIVQQDREQIILKLKYPFFKKKLLFLQKGTIFFNWNLYSMKKI